LKSGVVGSEEEAALLSELRVVYIHLGIHSANHIKKVSYADSVASPYISLKDYPTNYYSGVRKSQGYLRKSMEIQGVASDSKSLVRKDVPVRVRPLVPFKIASFIRAFFMPE